MQHAIEVVGDRRSLLVIRQLLLAIIRARPRPVTRIVSHGSTAPAWDTRPC